MADKLHCGLCGPDVECPGHPLLTSLLEAAVDRNTAALDREALEWETAELMMRTGGSFAQALGAAARAADPTNRRRLYDAFPDFFSRYAAQAQLRIAGRKTTP